MLESESKKYDSIFNDFTLPRIRNTKLVDLYKTWVIQNNSDELYCESCGLKLEKGVGAVHHIIPFNEESALGPDHYMNFVYVCNNCHNLFHNSKDPSLIKKFFDGINKNNKLGISIEKRIKELADANVLYQSCIDYAKRKKML